MTDTEIVELLKKVDEIIEENNKNRGFFSRKIPNIEIPLSIQDRLKSILDSSKQNQDRILDEKFSLILKNMQRKASLGFYTCAIDQDDQFGYPDKYFWDKFTPKLLSHGIKITKHYSNGFNIDWHPSNFEENNDKIS